MLAGCGRLRRESEFTEYERAWFTQGQSRVIRGDGEASRGVPTVLAPNLGSRDYLRQLEESPKNRVSLPTC